MIVVTLSALAAVGTIAVSGALAFEIRIHQQLNDAGLSGDRGRFLRTHVALELKQMHDDIDHGLEAGYDERHFDDCEFDGGAQYIRDRFVDTRRRLNSTRRIWDAPDSFGRGLHPTQDFYAHSNWVELGFPRGDLSNTPRVEVSLSDLTDLSGARMSIFERWSAPRFGQVVRDDILLGADDGGIIDPKWSIDRDGAGRHVPTLIDSEGRTLGRLLQSGQSKKRGIRFDRECDVASLSGAFPVSRFRGFLHDDLNKDSPSRGHLHQRARALAALQTSYEWCRLVREAAVGKTDGVLLTLWVKSGSSPHPAGTPCARGAAGTKPVTVSVESVRVVDNGDKNGVGEVQLAAALYDDPVEFRRSVHQTMGSVSIRDGAFMRPSGRPAPMTVCVDADDGATYALHGWDNDQDRKDHKSDRVDFDDHDDDDEMLYGGSMQIAGSTAPTNELRTIRSADLEATLRVTAGGVSPNCPQPPPPPPPNAAKPDLVISDFRIDEFTVTNQGAGAAGPFSVTLAGFDVFRFAGLASGASVRTTYPGNCEAEHRATADPGLEVDESNESNNVATFITIC